ncbi:hypothetical protein [Nevskia sp.]|uniref:hypothetical protein n=1 Tax=Nevskia sp. TaxID=1929292 RepID=UPI0025F37083|nr:hypothetical protein [Nevskia sp.]
MSFRPILLLSLTAALAFAGAPAFAAPAPGGEPASAAACVVTVRSVTTDMLLREADQQRLADKIGALLARANPAADTAASRVDVAITSYDKGSTYVRSMVSGLNDIHADVEVTVYRQPATAAAQTLRLSETFPGIGVEGSASRIGDIEDALVKAVAESLL